MYVIVSIFYYNQVVLISYTLCAFSSLTFSFDAGCMINCNVILEDKQGRWVCCN